MITKIEKFWPFLFIPFLLAILASSFFWPAISRPLAWTVIVLSVGLVIVLAVGRNLRSFREGRIDRPGLVRNLLVEVTGIVLTVLASVLIAGKVAVAAGQLAGQAAEAAWPGSGITVGILAGLLTAVLVGLGVGFLVRWVWGLLTRPKRSKLA